MIVCEVVVILIIGWLFEIYLLGNVLLFAFLCMLCRYEPQRRFDLYYGFQAKAVYFPFVVMGLTVLQGGSIMEDIIGLAVSEFMYFARETLPVKYGYNFLAPPQWFSHLVDWIGYKLFPDRPEARIYNARYQGRGHRIA